MMHISPTAARAAEQCAEFVAQLLQDAVEEKGWAAVAFSGGSTPKQMFAYLLKEPVMWEKVQIYQVDERGVPPGDPQSNATMIEETLLRKAGVPAANFHRMRGELEAEEAARLYEEELRQGMGEAPVFDVVVCGVGSDAHTASLFPGDALIEDRKGLVAATHVEKVGQWRITLLPRVLLAARYLLVLAAGADKAEAFGKIFDDRTALRDAPAKVLFETTGALHWYLDEAGAPR